MRPALLIFFIIGLLITPPAWAQSSDPIQDLWDVVNSILDTIQIHRTKLGKLSEKIDLHRDQISDLNTVSIQTQSNVVGLQNQINQLPSSTLSRNRIYEVAGSGQFDIRLYCNDANDVLLNSYCAGGFLGDLTHPSTTFFDDFSDGDYTNNPAWTVNSGNWYASSFALIVNTSFAGAISTPINMPAGYDYSIRFTAQQLSSNTLGSFKWFTSGGGRTADGYDITFHENGNIYLNKSIGGSPIILSQIYTYQNGIPNTIDILHHANGLIEVAVDGTPRGSALDTSINSGSAITLWNGNSNGAFLFDNISVSSSDLNGTGGFLNVADLDQPMGISCNYGREARIICYNPDN